MVKIKKPVPNMHEHILPNDKIIVSKTNTKGILTYVNEEFITLAGYSEEELLGVPHNIIRHPDMPKVIFKRLWNYIQRGDEINAYVKNLSKDGGFYWVLANVTPSYRDKKIIGYYSVRRKPNKTALNSIIIPLYKELLKLEKIGTIQDSEKALDKILEDKGVSYEEFIISIQN